MSSEQPKEQLPEYIINYNDVLVIRGFMIRAGYPEEQINAFEGQITAKLGEGHDTHPHPAPALDSDGLKIILDAACKETARKAREDVLEAIQDHNDGRLKGMEILFATPSNERTESAQDVYLKEAYFELTLVKHLIESLRSTPPQTEQEQPR